MGLRETILESKDLPLEAVNVPEWGVTLYVRTMTGTERDSFEQSMLDENGEAKEKIDDFRARLAVLTVVDETGQRVFGDADISALGAKSAAALDRIFAVSQRLNGLTKSDVDQLTKN